MEVDVAKTDQPYSLVAEAFDAITRILFSAKTVHQMLQQIVDFAVATVDGVRPPPVSLC